MTLHLPNGYKRVTSNWGHAHLHTNFSVQDGMAKPEVMVERAARYGQPFIASTDHGSLGATVQMYTSAKKYGVEYFPGIEAYVIDPAYDKSSLEDAGDAQRYHLGILALDLKGYQGLVGLSTLSYTRPRFSRFPRLLVDDLITFGKEYGDHIAITTGCVFGLVEKQLADSGPDAARGAIRTLQAVTPNLYVEIQKHNIPDGFNEMPEELVIKQMIEFADEFGLPLLATADCHYLDQSHSKAHGLMKRMLYGGKEDEFPGDEFHMCSTGWIQEKFEPEIWERVEDASADLLSKNKLVIPQLDEFKAHVPEVSKTPDKELYKQCHKKLVELGLDENDEYLNRLRFELEVIGKVKMANYFLLVLQCVQAMMSRGIPIETRGSGNGSLVLYLLGVTTVDPIVWNTNFSRFMAEDRLGAPDVDIDIADKDRWQVLEYLDNLEINGVKYKTSQIGTLSQLGQSKDDENDTGSAFNTYVSSLRQVFEREEWDIEKRRAERENKELEEQGLKPNVKPVKANADKRAAIRFADRGYSQLKRLDDVRLMMPEDYIGLKQIIDMKTVYKSRGKHAGGVLISGEDVRIEEFIPQMLIASSEAIVTQYPMKDVEKLGLLKMDWLGQTSLSVMAKCMEYLGKPTNDFSWIPNDDRMTIRYVANRKNHVGLFHLENYPKSVAMSELRPTCTADFVIHQAYSMPGAADSGAKDIYLQRRNESAWDADYEHPALKEVFDETNGVMLFQEQVLDVCRAVGMVGTELTDFFSIVKDSGAGATERNKKRLEESKPRFYELAQGVGFTTEETDWVWGQMIAMGGYGFNRAHAVGYGIRSYRTAYLKRHYPLEYMGALLYCWAGTNNTVNVGRTKVKKDEHYLKEAKRLNIPILPVQVNRSTDTWSIDRDKNALRKGYLSLPGVGAVTAQKIAEGQPYTSLEDFCERSGVSGSKPYLKDGTLNGVVGKLVEMEVLRFNG